MCEKMGSDMSDDELAGVVGGMDDDFDDDCECRYCGHFYFRSFDEEHAARNGLGTLPEGMCFQCLDYKTRHPEEWAALHPGS